MRPLLLPLALLAACAACPGPAPAPPDADVPFVEAPMVCANLARLGCAIGSDATCIPVMREAAAQNHTTKAALACAVSAGSQAAAVACDPRFFSCP